ncbi:Endo-type membrane-bound lytic murein transglycosylase A (EC [Olavius algarvensis associated proteobacterium Delta 3]|nr:Endo-type membrane-bound lytic murein transglycosylase A (EC [Olavius algarvensis associated proteobacterium Delta 3]CAB5136054.1 Endo-type membrane-bound lytic murein transglycosylase A (EC [Olavius algarvensis associated proteobacterium Delta 3]
MKQSLFIPLFLITMVACSSGDVVRVARIATTGDIASAERMAAEKAVKYATNPKALERDIREFEKLVSAFRKVIGGTWGDDEVEEPRPKKYVKYTQNYLSRASVDFDRGVVTVETLDKENPLLSLKTAIVTTLLTPDDPRSVDLYSAKPVKLGATPFLYKEIKDAEGKTIRWTWRAERYADWLIENKLATRLIRIGKEERTVHYVRFPMVKDNLQIRARKYKPIVGEYAQRFKVSPNLIYAVMKTESNFNPFAVSTAQAFGLMQIVPYTAGEDVYRFLNKRDGRPSKGFLFVPENNIQYGTAYLHLLNDQYLGEIIDPVSREYCVIAAYNAGPGSVLRTFNADRNTAPDKINRLAPHEVYQSLRNNLPRDESRRYLLKVIEAKKDFVAF